LIKIEMLSVRMLACPVVRHRVEARRFRRQ